MALKLGFKINRFLKLNRYRCLTKLYSSQSSKKFNCPVKSTSTLIQNEIQRKLPNKNAEPLPAVPISNKNDVKFLNPVNIISSENKDIPLISAELEDSPVTLRRKFAKSSTHSAITQPLKLPRLASPFPEPVKSLPSDTVSDEEKARVMQEEVKMEARYHLQMQQEMLLQQKLQNISQKHNVQLINNRAEQDEQTRTYGAITQPLKLPRLGSPFPEPVTSLPSDTVSDEKARLMQEEVKMEARYHLQTQQEMLLQQKLQKVGQSQQFQQNNQISKQQPEQTSFRKPKQYDELQLEEQDFPTTLKKIAINTSEKNVKDVKQNRTRATRCRRKAHTRAARYLRHSWYPRHVRKQMREYSTFANSPVIDPKIMTDSEQCDKIIRLLKSLYPEYQHLKRPILVPGSKEEKEFIRNILSLIGKLKSEQVNRATAPFPSYSEVKTYTHEPSKHNNNTALNKDVFNSTTLASGPLPRFYSTKLIVCPVLGQTKPARKKCPKFELQGRCKRTTETVSVQKNVLRKQEAPYPAYSEICDDSVADESDCNNCPWKPNKNWTLSTNFHNKYYSTSAGDSADPEIQAKKKPPCKNPFPPIPQCDYERTAENRSEKKRKKHCPKKKKKCKSASDIDSSKIISKIKAWLSSYRPDSENIKVKRSSDHDGREAYIIEVREYEEVTPQIEEKNLAKGEEHTSPEIVEIYQPPSEIKQVYPLNAKKMPFQNLEYIPIESNNSHAPEMTDPVPVLTKNIPEYNSHTENTNSSAMMPEELKLIEVKSKEVNPVKGIEVKPKEILKIMDKLDVKSPQNQVKPVETKLPELKLNLIKELLDTKKDSRMNIVKESFQYKSRNFSVNEVKKKEELKPKPVKLNIKKKSKDFKKLNIKHSISNQFKEFNVNDMKDYRNKPMPVACPIVTRSVPGLCSPPGCHKDTGGCKKRKEQPSNRKCRPPKKRKLPSCDDVKNKKDKSCISSLPIPGLEDKPQFMINAPRKTYFKKSADVSRFINLETRDFDVLANTKSATKDVFEPFKLKPQFWKKFDITN